MKQAIAPGSSAKSAPTTKPYSILIPKTKIEQFPIGFAQFLDQLRHRFGGYTILGEARGSWLDQNSGIRHDDHSLVVSVSIPADQPNLEALKAIVANAAHVFKELCIFISGADRTEFVWAAMTPPTPRKTGIIQLYLHMFGRIPTWQRSAMKVPTALAAFVLIGMQLFAAEPFIKIALLDDQTGSAAQNSTPALLPAHIAPLINVVKDRGGSIAIFAVRARAEGGMIRLAIDPPAPNKPQVPNLNVDVFEKRARLTRYRAALDQWNAQEQKRIHAAEEAIRVFEAQLRTVLVATRTEKRSDVWGSLVRIDRYLMEELPLPGYKVDPYVLIDSDCLDTAGGQRYTMASNPRVAWISRITNVPRIFAAPRLFENIDPAIAWIVSQAQEGKR